MRFLFLALLGLGVALSCQAETIGDWVAAAPASNVVFTAWNGDVPVPLGRSVAAHRLAQGFYGSLDLSRLPAESFPVKVRLLYDPIESNDVAGGRPDGISKPNDTAPAGIGQIAEETIVPTSQDAHALPVWTEPAPMQQRLRFSYAQESVRAEVLGQDGQLLARLALGASSFETERPRALLINAAAARAAFLRDGYSNISEATRLVPDSFALAGVDAVWIDTATANDPGLGNSFWEAVLLGGTKVVGLPGDIALLSRRLGLKPGESVLSGGLIAAASPQDLSGELGQVQPVYGSRIDVESANPFAFAGNLGEMIHHELLIFSLWYLFIFTVLQALVIVFAFQFFRGANRVRIWVVVPCFALGYAILGVAFSHGIVRVRSDSHLTQVELERAGWPQGVVFTSLQQLNLQAHESVLRLPPDSRPFFESNVEAIVSSDPSGVFYHDSSRAQLDFRCGTTAQTAAHVRSLVAAAPPFTMTADGKLDPARRFPGAWLWDGAQWHDLGPLTPDHPCDWKTAAVIHPRGILSPGNFVFLGEDSSFPGKLAPLLSGSTASSLAATGDALFLGAEQNSDLPLSAGHDDRVAFRRVLAYQFPWAGGSP